MAKKNPETLFKEIVQRHLADIEDLWVVKVQQVTLRGTPDMLICYKGRFFAWELKTDVGVASKLQLHTINKINKAGGVARIVTPSNFQQCWEELLNADQSK